MLRPRTLSARRIPCSRELGSFHGIGRDWSVSCIRGDCSERAPSCRRGPLMTDVAERSKLAMKDVGLLAAQGCESTVDGDPGAPADAPAEDPQVQELTLALAARDRFLSLIGHELRNTLAPMMLLAEQFGMLAEGSQPPGKVLSRVAMLTNNLNKLMATIGRIVEVADLRRGKVPLAPSTTNLVEVVR